MAETKQIKRRIIHIAKSKRKATFESLTHLKRDWKELLSCKSLASEPKFLRRMAINIKHTHHEAARALHQKVHVTQARRVSRFLSTPIAVPHLSLLEAADTYSEQEPKHSDLSELLRTVAHCHDQLAFDMAIF